MRDHGPTRGELRFRLIVSLAGLALMLVAIFSRDFDSIAWIEVALIGTAFFGGTAVLSVRALLRKPR